MFSAAIIAILIALVLTVARALLGPTSFDRLLAVNTIGNLAVMLLALFGFLSGRPMVFLDIAITYALLNMIGTLAVLKFFRYGGLGYLHHPAEPTGPAGSRGED